MPECIYKDKDESKCFRSTCEHHCQVVSDETCNKCMLNQESTTVSDKVLLKRVIKDAIIALKDSDIEEAMTLLGEALKI